MSSQLKGPVDFDVYGTVIGMDKLQKVAPYETYEDLAYSLMDITQYSGPVPQQYALTVLRLLRTLTDMVRVSRD